MTFMHFTAQRAPTDTAGAEAQAQALGLKFVDAPVSGGQAGAQNGMLTVMCGGEPSAFEAVKPVAMAFSRAFTLLGPAGAGKPAKLAHPIPDAGQVQGLSGAGPGGRGGRRG